MRLPACSPSAAAAGPRRPRFVDPVPDRRLPADPLLGDRGDHEAARRRHSDLVTRVADHAAYVASPKGKEDLSGGAARLQVALALASREVVTPRITPDGEAVGVGLVDALRARAVVMWRMHADVMPAMTVLALADPHDAAGQAGVSWTLMLDEFGAVIKMAANRAVTILQRGRSHGGQVIVVTQSVADPEALSGQPGLLPSLTDNFSGIVAHRQAAPESRDWLAKLMGTRALAIDKPDVRARYAAFRARLGSPSARVPDRIGHVR